VQFQKTVLIPLENSGFFYSVNGFPDAGSVHDQQVRLPAILGFSYNAAL
jgi:hypothetical protein